MYLLKAIEVFFIEEYFYLYIIVSYYVAFIFEFMNKILQSSTTMFDKRCV